MNTKLLALLILIGVGIGFLIGIRFNFGSQFVGLACGILIPLIALDRTRQRAPWAKIAFVVVGACAILISVSNLTLQFHSIDLSNAQKRLFYMADHVIEGFVLGLIFALIASGELFGRKRIATP